jgi:hypothetical protein
MKSGQKKILWIGLVFGLALVIGILLNWDKGLQVFEQQGTPPEIQKSISENSKQNESMPAVAQSENTILSASEKTASPDDNPYAAYPPEILELLGIDKEKVVAGRDAFKKSVIHVEWMDRINEVLKNLDSKRKEAIIQNHISHLYLKDLLNEAYLSGKIDHETFIKAVADLMKWHQKTYETILTDMEYEALFEVKPEAADGLIDEMMEAAPKYSFILNQDMPAQEVANQVQGYKLDQVDAHFKNMVLERGKIGKKINSGEMTLEQAREALAKSQQEFIAKCKELLTEDEIKTIFGSIEALERGGTNPEPPAVIGDSDIMELGFMIENPTTTVEMVKEKINKQKLEDIKFFYQQMDKEKQELIAKLDAGEIKEDVFDNMAKEMDRTFEENCQSVLTHEEYRLIFDRQEGAPSEGFH